MKHKLLFMILPFLLLISCVMPTETNLLDIYDDNTATDEQILALQENDTWVFTRTDSENLTDKVSGSGIRGYWIYQIPESEGRKNYTVGIWIYKPNKYYGKLSFFERYLWGSYGVQTRHYEYKYFLERNKQSGTKIQFHGYKYKLWVSEHYLALTDKERAD